MSSNSPQCTPARANAEPPSRHIRGGKGLQLTYRPRDEGPRADPRRLTDVHGTGQAHTAHLDRKSGLLNSDPPPWAVASDGAATRGVGRGVDGHLVLVVVRPL